MTLLLAYAAATAVMAATTVTMPEHRPLAPAMFVIGLIGTWRQFLGWLRSRATKPARQ